MIWRQSQERGGRCRWLLIARSRIWSGWDGVGTAAVTLVGSIAYFTRVACTSTLSKVPLDHFHHRFALITSVLPNHGHFRGSSGLESAPACARACFMFG